VSVKIINIKYIDASPYREAIDCANALDQGNDEYTIEELTSLLKDSLIINNMISNADSLAEGYIRYGKILNALKALVVEKERWQDFCARELDGPELTPTSRKRYMAIARIPNVSRWSRWGVARLERIAKALRGDDYVESNDPILTFMVMHNLPYDFKGDPQLYNEELRIDIDTAIDMDVLKKKGIINVDRKRVRNLRAIGIDVTTKKHIPHLDNSEHEANAYMDRLFTNMGTISAPHSPPSIIVSYSRQAAVFESSVDRALNDKDYRCGIDEEELKNLTRKMLQLLKIKIVENRDQEEPEEGGTDQ